MSHVTCHVTNRDADRDMSRVTVHVSHATTTTPHHTMSLVTTVGGCCDHHSIHRCSLVRDHSETMDEPQAAIDGGQR